MGYLVFDTETSGLFVFKDKITGKPVPADDPCQPRLASLAMIRLDDDLQEVGRALHYVRPDGWAMAPEATAVNGLTTEFLMGAGAPVAHALDDYEQAIRSGQTITAFNAQFDCKMMRGEFRRAGRDDLFAETRNSCLMRSSQKLKLFSFASATPGFPKLREVAAFFDHGTYDEHSAMADAEAAVAVLRGLIRLRALIPPAVHYAKQTPAA